MREIKFRAWDGTKMLHDVGFHPSIIEKHKDYKDGEAGQFTICPKFDNYKLMQFTGLKDKNGKDIYEGDIIPCKVGIQDYANWTVGDPDSLLNGVVEWNEHQLCWQIGFKSNEYSIISCSFGWGSTPKLEIIGNIYETPHLL